MRQGTLALASASFLITASGWATEPRPIEEIVVTAQRLEQNARDVPIAISAFDGAMIEDRRILGLADLRLFVPSLTYTTNDFSDVNIAIRGVGTRVAASEGQSGVSLHINDAPMPNGLPPIELYDRESGRPIRPRVVDENSGKPIDVRGIRVAARREA